MKRHVALIWISLTSGVMLPALAQPDQSDAERQASAPLDVHSAALEQDQSLYAVIDQGVPVRWSEAKARLVGQQGLQDILFLRLTEQGFTPLQWQQWEPEAGQGETARTVEDTIGLLSIDRRVPTVEFGWQGQVTERNGMPHVRPDSQLRLQFSDDSGLDSFKAFVNQTETTPPDLWPEGQQHLIIYATDKSGNAGRAGETRFMVDGSPPDIRCEADRPAAVRAQVYQLPLRLSCMSDDDSGVSAFVMQSGDAWVPVPAESFESASAELVLKASDRLGQTRQRTLSWPIDDQPPVIRIDLPDQGRIEGEDIFIDPGQRIAVTIEDAGIGVMEARYRYNNGDWAEIPETIRFLDRGWYLLDIEATDHFGHTTTRYWYVRTGSPRSQRPRRS